MDKRFLKIRYDRIKEKNKEIEQESEKFLIDKEKIEHAMERVSYADISEEDRRELLGELDAVDKKLEEEYNEKVVEEKEKVDYESNELINEVNYQIEELQKEIDYLDQIVITTQSVDFSRTKEIALDSKEELEQLSESAQSLLEDSNSILTEHRNRIKQRRR